MTITQNVQLIAIGLRGDEKKFCAKVNRLKPRLS